MSDVNQSELGKKSQYVSEYNPDILFPISRQIKRDEIGISANQLPFHGYDCWNHYEVSWLNSKGKPQVAIAEIIYDCHSPNIIESKSLKLYFNSFNNTKVESVENLTTIIKTDLSARIGAQVQIKIFNLQEAHTYYQCEDLNGDCLDELDITMETFDLNPQVLKTESILTKEILYSNLLKSNCLVTFQPDWGSVQIEYQGPKINRESLLQYILSFRNHNEFHEQCIERIFIDILRHCKPIHLSVLGRYTRRGGLDINPFRTTDLSPNVAFNKRLIRQ
jgi:7-cyano-7-deazaguanine reductase